MKDVALRQCQEVKNTALVENIHHTSDSAMKLCIRCSLEISRFKNDSGNFRVGIILQPSANA